MHRAMPDEGGDRMRRDRSEPMNLFALVSALSLALDPVLTEQDRVLHDDTLVQAVTADLIRRLPRTPIDGRPGAPSPARFMRMASRDSISSNPFDRVDSFPE